MKPIDIATALTDEHLLAAGLESDLSTWGTWLVTLKAAFGLELDDTEREVFAQIAGDRQPPGRRVKELWCVIGRRSGKSRMAAAIAVFLSLFQKHRLAKGERGYVLVLAETVDQAKAVHDYARGFISSSAVLSREVASTTATEIRLRNNITLATFPNSFRSVRGKTLVGCVFDEVAYWRDETSASPDIEVFRAVKPSLLASGATLVGISTPYRRIGLLHSKHRDHFGVDSDDVLVVAGDSLTFNPSLDEAEIEKERAADPEAVVNEWDARFRTDISAFLSEDVIELAIDRSRPPELPPRKGVGYQMFIDASGGRHDHYVACVGHKDGDRFVADVLRGKGPPLDPQQTTREIAELAKQYGIHVVHGDAYSADWIVSAFRECDVTYERAEKNRSELYLEGLPAFSRGLVSLPEHRRLERELRLLERHVSRAGRDRVDHGRSGSDDYSNAVFGALNLVLAGSTFDHTMAWGEHVGTLVDMFNGQALSSTVERRDDGSTIAHYQARFYGW